MSKHDLYPIVVFQSRYGGVYEGAEWFAISGFENMSSGLDEYFNGDDDAAVDFWHQDHEFPIAVGNTPNEAVNSLIANFSKSDTSVSYKEIVSSTSINKPKAPGFHDVHLERTGFYEQSMGFGINE